MPIEINESDLKSGLIGVIVALVEIIQEVLEKEAVRRMESGKLSDEEIERLGNGLRELDGALKHIIDENGLQSIVKSLRTDLDRLVEDTVEVMTNPENINNNGDLNDSRK